jgi:hypothetical protein
MISTFDLSHCEARCAEALNWGGDMLGIKLQKRDNDFFISYGHGGLARVLPLIDLLKRDCGLKIWFDSTDGNASERSSELLVDGCLNPRRFGGMT